MRRSRLVIAPVSDDPETRRAVLAAAVDAEYRRFLLRPGETSPRGEQLEILIDEGDQWRVPESLSGRPIPVRKLTTRAELEGLLGDPPSASEVAIRWTSDRVIPLEGLISHRRGRGAVWVVARSPEETPAALGALEHGADHVVVEVQGPEDVARLARLVDSRESPALQWEAVTVGRVVPVGPGDRVIVDTTSLLRPEEGLLVGSSAGFLFHVASEAVGSEFSRARPFRVNAGSAHSYVLMSDGTTRYLAELAPGDSVLVADPAGATRTARVGRLKVERRPLVLVEAIRGTRNPTVFLQEAETVRLSGEPKGPIPTTLLGPGSKVWGVVLPPARHLGEAIDETIEER